MNTPKPEPVPDPDDWEAPLEPRPGPRMARRYFPVCAAFLLLALTACGGGFPPVK